MLINTHIYPKSFIFNFYSDKIFFFFPQEDKKLKKSGKEYVKNYFNKNLTFLSLIKPHRSIKYSILSQITILH